MICVTIFTQKAPDRDFCLTFFTPPLRPMESIRPSQRSAVFVLSGREWQGGTGVDLRGTFRGGWITREVVFEAKSIPFLENQPIGAGVSSVGQALSIPFPENQAYRLLILLIWIGPIHTLRLGFIMKWPTMGEQEPFLRAYVCVGEFQGVQLSPAKTGQGIRNRNFADHTFQIDALGLPIYCHGLIKLDKHIQTLCFLPGLRDFRQRYGTQSFQRREYDGICHENLDDLDVLYRPLQGCTIVQGKW